jgi:hypothetical protein
MIAPPRPGRTWSSTYFINARRRRLDRGGALPGVVLRDPADDSRTAHFPYLRFAAAVMSTDSFAMKLAPHQLDPGAGNGLIGVVAIPLAV